MPNFTERVAQNVPGRFYVDFSCIYCRLCDEIAPSVFKQYRKTRLAYVHAQPSTPEEVALCLEAAKGCPTESIGTDGDQFDWTAIPPHPRSYHTAYPCAAAPGHRAPVAIERPRGPGR